MTVARLISYFLFIIYQMWVYSLSRPCWAKFWSGFGNVEDVICPRLWNLLNVKGKVQWNAIIDSKIVSMLESGVQILNSNQNKSKAIFIIWYNYLPFKTPHFMSLASAALGPTIFASGYLFITEGRKSVWKLDPITNHSTLPSLSSHSPNPLSSRT